MCVKTPQAKNVQQTNPNPHPHGVISDPLVRPRKSGRLEQQRGGVLARGGQSPEVLGREVVELLVVDGSGTCTSRNKS